MESEIRETVFQSHVDIELKKLPAKLLKDGEPPGPGAIQ